MNTLEERKHWHNLEAQVYDGQDDRPKCDSCESPVEIHKAFSNDDWEYYGICVNVECPQYQLSVIV